jgi:hypothetical protein
MVEPFCFGCANAVHLHELGEGGLAIPVGNSTPHVNCSVAIFTLDSRPHQRCRAALIVVVPPFVADKGAVGIITHLTSVVRNLQSFGSDAFPCGRA